LVQDQAKAFERFDHRGNIEKMLRMMQRISIEFGKYLNSQSVIEG
jgi:hypothetical protein